MWSVFIEINIIGEPRGFRYRFDTLEEIFKFINLNEKHNLELCKYTIMPDED